MKFNRYQLVTELNRGSYGVVHLARDRLHAGRLVAVKCLDKTKRSDQSHTRLVTAEEAAQEIAIHRHLGSSVHRNIIRLSDHFESIDKTYLVMEYYESGDLYEAISANRGPRQQGKILQFMLQLIDAVEFCHSKKVYHRDIKPENILLAKDGTIKLTDFGLATTIRHNSEFGVGSERYMAPELFDHTTAPFYDASRVDIWSVGICLLNILFGKNPFTVANQNDKLFMDYAANREALYDIFPTLSSDTFAVLRNALTFDPDNRSLARMRQKLFDVKNWTTDDEVHPDLSATFALSTAPVKPAPITRVSPREISRATSADTSSEDNLCTSVPTSFGSLEPPMFKTTQGRAPFRTPSVMSPAETPILECRWDRKMQFTPPVCGQRVLKTNAITTTTTTTRPPEVNQPDDITSRRSDPLCEDEGVFVMDDSMDLADKLQPLQLSTDESHSSGAESLAESCVPSLVCESVQDSIYVSPLGNDENKHPDRQFDSLHDPHLLSQSSNYLTPTTHSAKPTISPFVLGKSWTDLAFAADDDDEYDDQFYSLLSSGLITQKHSVPIYTAPRSESPRKVIS